MTNHVTQTCTIPIRKLELLGGELRLLKSAIEQLQGRCELLLSEIADLRHDHDVADEKLARESEPDSPDQLLLAEISDKPRYAERLNTASIVSAALLVGGGDEESRA